MNSLVPILVTGARGQLGSEIREIVETSETGFEKYKFVFIDREELDLKDSGKIREFLNSSKFDYIINCAAYTAVDGAEGDAENAGRINIDAVESIAILSKERNSKLIHISTDYIFAGENYKPYRENDFASPLNVYGKTKLEGENRIIESRVDSIIIRTSWLYSCYGQNFVKTIRKLAEERDVLNIVFDQIGTPTYGRDLAEVIIKILLSEDKKLFGRNTAKIYHYSNEGVTTWYDFARAIVELSSIQCEVNPVKTENYSSIARRPYYSVLDKEKIKRDLNIRIPYWRDSLKDCIRRLNK